jgi:hypothetical protein
MAQEKDKMIVRQSTMKWLLDYCKHINVNLQLSDIVRITEALTFYVVDGRTKDVQSMMEKVDKFILEKFEEK